MGLKNDIHQRLGFNKYIDQAHKRKSTVFVILHRNGHGGLSFGVAGVGLVFFVLVGLYLCTL